MHAMVHVIGLAHHEHFITINYQRCNIFSFDHRTGSLGKSFWVKCIVQLKKVMVVLLCVLLPLVVWLVLGPGSQSGQCRVSSVQSVSGYLKISSSPVWSSVVSQHHHVGHLGPPAAPPPVTTTDMTLLLGLALGNSPSLSPSLASNI